MVGYTKTGAPKANGLQLRPRASFQSDFLGGSMSGSAKAAHTQQLQQQPPKQEATPTLRSQFCYCNQLPVFVVQPADPQLGLLSKQAARGWRIYLSFLFSFSILSFSSTSLSSISSTFPLIYQIEKPLFPKSHPQQQILLIRLRRNNKKELHPLKTTHQQRDQCQHPCLFQHPLALIQQRLHLLNKQDQQPAIDLVGPPALVSNKLYLKAQVGLGS